MSILPRRAHLPRSYNLSSILSLEYFSSMSEFILSLIGWDRLVTNLQVPSSFGITPMRDICKVKIGILVNGPKIIPLETSLFSFARVSA